MQQYVEWHFWPFWDTNENICVEKWIFFYKLFPAYQEQQGEAELESIAFL